MKINVDSVCIWSDDKKILKKFFRDEEIEMENNGFAEFDIVEEYDDENKTIRAMVILCDDDGNRMTVEVMVFGPESNKIQHKHIATDITIHCIKTSKDATEYDVKDLFNTLGMIEKKLIDEFEDRYLRNKDS